MNYVVYLDVFLMINIFMDFLILVIAKSLIRPETTLIRCIIAALMGGVLSVISMMIPYKAISLRFITSYILICFVMSKIAFMARGIRNNIKNMFIIYAITFLLGGVMNALYYKTNINLLRFISIGLTTYLIADFVVKRVAKKGAKSRFYKVNVCVKEKIATVMALLDTGNMLFEPISGRKVHIIEFDAIKDIVDKENSFYRVIPFNSVGKERGLLDAIEADYIEFVNDKGDLIRIDNQIIALYDKKLTLDGRFEGLLHSSISELI